MNWFYIALASSLSAIIAATVALEVQSQWQQAKAIRRRLDEIRR